MTHSVRHGVLTGISAGGHQDGGQEKLKSAEENEVCSRFYVWFIKYLLYSCVYVFSCCICHLSVIERENFGATRTLFSLTALSAVFRERVSNVLLG